MFNIFKETDRLLLTLDVSQNVDEVKQAYLDPSGSDFCQFLSSFSCFFFFFFFFFPTL